MAKALLAVKIVLKLTAEIVLFVFMLVEHNI